MVQQRAVVVVAAAVLAGLVAAEPGCYSCSYSSNSGHPGKFGHSGHSGQPGNFGHPGQSGQGSRSGGHRFGSAGALAQAGVSKLLYKVLKRANVEFQKR